MQHVKRHFKRYMLWSGSITLLLVILTACGGATNGASYATSSTGSARTAADAAQSTNNSANSKAAASTQQEKSAKFIGPQYLIKSLKVNLEVKDTRKVANDLQNWISATDPRATSSGMDYQQSGNNLYTITMTISVQASIYPKIQQYLGSYAAQHGGQLLGMTETVQDVTGTYVDTQSRLKNLRVEQARLQELMSRAQNLTDLLAIEQRLTDVEGQIESTQAQLNILTSQVTFYPITISLQPVETAPPPPTPPGWSIGQVFQDATAASIAFGQGLVSFVIWLLAFSIYIIPVAALAWFIRRWRTRSSLAARPKMPPFASFTVATPPVARQKQEETTPPPATADADEEAATPSAESGSPEEQAISSPGNSHH